MRVAKSNQLRRLLQTQDVLISVLVAALCINYLWFLGTYDTYEATNLLKILGFVGIFSAVASIIHYPRLRLARRLAWNSVLKMSMISSSTKISQS